VAHQTLQDRAVGRTINCHQAHLKFQILSQAEEAVLLEWSTLSALAAKPVSGRSLRGQALAISGKLPGRHWHRRFIRRNPSLVLGKASGLDPK